MPIPLYIYFIGFSLLAAIINYRWLKPSRLQWFVPFLALTLVTELLGVYTKDVLDVSNDWLYNSYTWVQVLFFSFFYRSLRMPGPYRRIIEAGVIVYTVSTVIIYLWYTPVTEFSIGLFLSGGFMVVLFAIFFLFNYFSLDDRLKERSLVPVTWITVGTIAYFTVLSITVSLIKYIRQYDLELGGEMLYNLVPRVMSVLMYTCFVYAFFLCRRINRK
ncbi:MAG TPA: hypothetical protein VLD19_08905 [Chitinophagaceae bacterium]|nr:hypothetical protein [Chitinophagaceae bacterium]